MHKHTHMWVNSCWSWCILLGPSAVALWRVYFQAQSRWSGQYNILTVSREGYRDLPMHSFISLSHISFHWPFLFSFSVSLPLPHLFILPFSSPPLPPLPPLLTVILWYSFLLFISVSTHFAPGRQWIKSSDRQVLVLLLVLSKTARCQAPASVWCSLHQYATLKSKTEEKKTDRYFLWAHLLSTLPNNHFYGSITLMCVSYICEWMTECVRVCVYLSVCKRISLCLCSSPRETGKNDTSPNILSYPWAVLLNHCCPKPTSISV